MSRLSPEPSESHVPEEPDEADQNPESFNEEGRQVEVVQQRENNQSSSYHVQKGIGEATAWKPIELQQQVGDYQDHYSYIAE
jgi:hypothetical protein